MPSTVWECPADLLAQIFSNLSLHDRSAAELTCRTWRHVLLTRKDAQPQGEHKSVCLDVQPTVERFLDCANTAPNLVTWLASIRKWLSNHVHLLPGLTIQPVSPSSHKNSRKSHAGCSNCYFNDLIITALLPMLGSLTPLFPTKFKFSLQLLGSPKALDMLLDGGLMGLSVRCALDEEGEYQACRPPPELFALPSLRSVSLEQVDDCLDALAGMHQLRTISLSCQGLALPLSLAPLHRLTKLKVSKCDMTGDVSVLSQLTALKVLALELVLFLGHFREDALASLTCLESLTYSGLQTEFHMSSFNNCTQLTSVHIEEDVEGIELMGFTGLPCLKDLCLDGVKHGWYSLLISAPVLQSLSHMRVLKLTMRGDAHYLQGSLKMLCMGLPALEQFHIRCSHGKAWPELSWRNIYRLRCAIKDGIVNIKLRYY